jgi:hypothetical protein
MATGEKSGTWGTITNTNLELIGEALGYGTEAIATDADTTITMADATSDGVRALYLKITSGVSLTATRTVTLAPNTVSKVWIVENATSGSQSISISQGSGANVTIPNGAVKIIYTDGAGAGAAVTDALVDVDLASFSVAGTAVTATGAELNVLDGITATTAELNILDGVTATTAELNILDGVTATTAELNYNDITTLGTVQASKTVTADASANVTWGDNEKAIFGAGSDLQIYHDGSNSIIDDIGTGNLYIRSNDILLDKYTGERMIRAIADGAVTLYYDNAAKLATTTSGVSVTGKAVGTMTTDNDLSFDMNASNQFKCTPTANGTLTFTNITSGQSGQVLLVNTGGYTISAAATTKVSSTALATISTAGTYLLSYFSDGTNVYVVNSGALS